LKETEEEAEKRIELEKRKKGEEVRFFNLYVYFLWVYLFSEKGGRR
jgi:hypothetical protein